MVRLKINNRNVSIKEGSTLLTAARKLAIEIPALCFLNGYKPFTSCMICIVEELNSGNLLPACSALVVEGMVIETENERVREARRDALELLLSDHVGDCDAPCQQICPARMNIPQMIRQIASNELRDAIITIKRDIALPAVLGRICPAPCEKGCRRGQVDEPVAICLLKRYAADADLAAESNYLPQCKPDSGKRVAIVGSGPTGLAAAYYLRQEGHGCHIFDERPNPGGMLRYGVPQEKLPHNVLDSEINIIRKLGAEFGMDTEIGKDISMAKLRTDFDAIVLAVGKITPDTATDFGVERSTQGIRVNIKTFETSQRSVFAGGNAIRKGRMAVTSVAHGKSIAHSVNQFLNGLPLTGLSTRFNSHIGRLKEGESAEFMKEVDNSPRQEPARGLEHGFSNSEASTESKRCLHCDCRKADSCKLRQYAGEYGANQQRYKVRERNKFEKIVQHANILYEPEKCIKCGLCVQITAKAGERLGLTFIGRGFEVRIGVPFNESLRKGLEKVADDCVEACPTGALAFRD